MAYTSSNDYLKDLELLLKKNRGTRVNTLYDTASNVPDQLQTADPIPQKRSVTPMEPDDIGQLELSLPQITPRKPGQVMGASEGITAQQFLEQLGQIYFSPEVQQNATPQGQTIDQEGGYLGIDNKFYYDDGTVRESSDASAYPIGSAPNGTGLLYSDGSIRRERQEGEYMSVPAQEEYGMASVGPNQTRTNLGNIREYTLGGKPIKSFDEYLQMLSGNKLSGKDITGNYGDYYGLPRESYNIGTDIGTAKLGGNQASLALPFSAKVISISRWDNKDQYTTKTPYGNSVLVQLPTGHMIRFSHLSELGNIQEGQNIGAGTYLGKTGNTGYAFGQHLDHELYNPDGTLSSSEAFFNDLQSNPQVAQKLTGGGEILGNTIANAPQSQPNIFASIPQSQPTTIDKAVSGVENAVGTGIRGAADYIEKTKPTGNYGLGLTELAKLDTAGAGKELGSTIEKLNPTGNFDLGISEALAGNSQLSEEKRRQTAQNVGQGIAGIGEKAGLPEFGVSEFISQLPDMFNQPVYAGEMGEKYQPNVFQQALSKAGQGVSNLKNELGGFIDNNVFKKKDLASIGQKNVIGEDTGGAIASNMGDIKSTPADNRNAFFKAGGLDTYKDYLSPGVTSGYRGALDTKLFSDKFYENPDNVANVFGNTSLGKDATGKYRSYMGKQYPVVEGLSPTIKKSEQYLGSYDGLTIDGEYWKDVFMRQGKDINSGEGKSFQERERQNQQTYSWDEPNQAYYDNEYNRSVIQSIPEVLKSAFSFMAPRTGQTSYGGMSSPQGLYQPVQGDISSKPDYSKAKSSPQLPVSNVFKPQGQIQSVPQSMGGAINKPTIPKPTPVPTPTQYGGQSIPTQYGGQSIPTQYGGQSIPTQYGGQSIPTQYGGQSIPTQYGGQSIPTQYGGQSISKPQPNSSYNGQPVYNAPPKPSTPSYSPPKPTPVPTPSYSAPKPAPSYTPPKPSYTPPKPAPVPTPKPAAPPKSAPKPAQTNVFQNLVNYLFGRR